MIEKVGHIRNPLTVIAIFAAIAEISGTTVLPFIEANNQNIYIWFLIFFPIFLVGVFFLTLNFNHRVLYAPSDYTDEKNFVSSLVKARPDEQSKKLHDEVKEVEADEAKKQSKSAPVAKGEFDSIPVERVIRDRKREIMADVVLAEKLSINKLSKDLGLNFKTGIKFEFPFSSKIKATMSVAFDAAHVSNDSVHAVEVKLFKASVIDYSRLHHVVTMSEKVANQCSDVSSKDFTLHIFVVVDAPDIDIDSIKKSLAESVTSSEIKVVTYVATLNDLQNEYQYST